MALVVDNFLSRQSRRLPTLVPAAVILIPDGAGRGNKKPDAKIISRKMENYYYFLSLPPPAAVYVLGTDCLLAQLIASVRCRRYWLLATPRNTWNSNDSSPVAMHCMSRHLRRCTGWLRLYFIIIIIQVNCVSIKQRCKMDENRIACYETVTDKGR